MERVREMPVFHAAAAMLIGVFGVVVSLSAVAVTKGSDARKACLVEVTSEERLEVIRELLRGGRAE